MKKILLLTATALMMGTSVSAQSVATATEVHPLQITAMEEGKIPTREFNTKILLSAKQNSIFVIY